MSISCCMRRSSSSYKTASRALSTRTTHFGFETVDEVSKKARVGDVFRRVAEKYDVMNDLMSAGVHRLWKDEFVRMAGRVVAPAGAGAVCLDVAGGTGDVAFRIADAMTKSYVRPAVAPRIVITDINEAMLDVGKERAVARGFLKASEKDDLAPKLEWRVGDAEDLSWVPDSSVDLYTIAFGIRNCTHVDKVLTEAHRVLRPGGRFMCLEFSHVLYPGLREAYEAYSFAVIPAIGAAVANDRASYQYLVESIRNFPNQETFADMIADAGFGGVTYNNFTCGIAAVHSGFKLAKTNDGNSKMV